MRPIHAGAPEKALLQTLRIDCKHCCGLCCVALYFAKSDGFPEDKESGTPCRNLTEDFRCAIHEQLGAKGMHGCMAYDCLGAGQRVTQTVYQGADWRQEPMLDCFLTVYQLHQMLWYLTEAATLYPAADLQGDIRESIASVDAAACQTPEQLHQMDIEALRAPVNRVLCACAQAVQQAVGVPFSPLPRDQIGKKLRGKSLQGQNLTGALLIAADLSNCTLFGTSLLAADLRDANVCGADLRDSIFLTQAQINTARGDGKTRLPPMLRRPATWNG